MSTSRRLFLGLSLAAPAIAVRADAAGAPAAASFATRSALREGLGAAAPRDGEILTDGRVSYLGRPGTTAIPDLPGLLPFGEVSAEHWGVEVDTRAAAARNAAALNRAADYCRDRGQALHLPAGSVFIADRVNFSGLRVRGQGVSALRHMPAYYDNKIQTPAASQIVLTGEAFTPIRLHGISSMKACGAARTIEPRDGLSEASWELVSLMNADATEGEATPAALAVGILIEGLSGTCLERFRVVADSGGPQGLDGYNDKRNARLFGRFDIGILQIGARNTTLIDMQTLGHFRRYGYLNAAVDADNDYADYTAPYETTLERCNFQGLRSFGLRGPDKFVILDWTADSVDLPWADDHPFTTDPGHALFRLTSRGTGTTAGKSFGYDRVRRVSVAGGVRLRLGGLSGFDPGEHDAVVPAISGGANSHIVLRDCQIGGLLIPSGHAANDTRVLDDPIRNGAIGGFEISGWRCAEADIQGRVQSPGTVAGFIHDCREVVLDLLCEPNPTRGQDKAMTWIMSPQVDQNRHAAHPAGGLRWLEWRYGIVSEATAGVVDHAPFMGFLPRPALFAGIGRGWFEGNWALRAPHIRYYTRANGQDVDYMPLPALAAGPGTQGARGAHAEDPVHIHGAMGTEAALRLSDAERSLRLFLDAARENGLVLREERDGALWDVLRSVTGPEGPALRIGGGVEVDGPVQAAGGIGFAPVAADALGDARHAVNTRGKAAGRAVFDSTNARVLVASGGAPRDPWHLFDGTPAVRPR
ncbi:hypothetical protein [Salipiger sp.]|uniref:hypothetical protein n=1 Tax=Salipiger sp. TaxID=2078585 RepID=UPI003A978191